MYPCLSPETTRHFIANARRQDAASGLSKSELEMLPQQTGNGSGPVDQCCICMEDMTSTETIVRLPACLHTFHRCMDVDVVIFRVDRRVVDGPWHVDNTLLVVTI